MTDTGTPGDKLPTALRSREGIVGNPTPRGNHRLAQFLRPWTFHLSLAPSPQKATWRPGRLSPRRSIPAALSGALPLRTSIIGSASEVRFTRSDFGMRIVPCRANVRMT